MIVNLDVTCTFKTSFHSYKSAAKNKRAVNAIKKWVRETLENECSYIPIYVETDGHGSVIEDTSRRLSHIKITVEQT